MSDYKVPVILFIILIIKFLLFLQFSILLEYCSNGDLLSYIKEHSGDFKLNISQTIENPIMGIVNTTLENLSENTRNKIHSMPLLVIWSYQVIYFKRI